MNFEIELKPAERRSLFCAIQLYPIEVGEEFPKPELSIKSRDEAIMKWFEFSGKKLAGSYPTEAITQTLAQAKACLAIQAKSAISSHLEHPSLSNMVDLARTIIALSRCGCSTILEEAILKKKILEITDTDSILPIIWALSETAKIDLDHRASYEHTLQQLLKTHASKIIRSFDSEYGVADKHIHEYPITDPDVILVQHPSIPSSNEFVPYDPSIRELTFSDLSIFLLILAFTRIAINAGSENTGLSDERLVSLQESIKRLLGDAEKNLLAGNWSEHLSSQEEVRQALDLLGLVALLRDDTLDVEALLSLSMYLEKEYIFRGLFRPSSDSKQVTSYLSLHLAHLFALYGKRDLTEHIFNWVLKHRSSYGFLPETINMETRNGGRGSGCSIKAAQGMVILVREMLLVERGNNLIVAQGVPEEWFTTDAPLTVKEIPTAFGPIGIEFAPSANQHQIEITLDQLPEEIEFNIPSHFPLNMIKAYGGGVIERIEEDHLIRIVPFSESVVLAYHRI
jgi:hypothetical protein